MCQEVLGSRVEQFAASACRHGLRSLRIWMVPIARGELAVIRIEMADSGAALAGLAASEVPFEIWLRRQLQRLIGVDLIALAETPGELVLEWIKEVRV
jgi:hypothetical protein